MKNLLIAVGLMIAATAAQASTLSCDSKGYPTVFVVKDGVLLDTNENIIAAQIEPNTYQATDGFGTVTYTVQDNKVIMKFAKITKVYTCH